MRLFLSLPCHCCLALLLFKIIALDLVVSCIDYTLLPGSAELTRESVGLRVDSDAGCPFECLTEGRLDGVRIHCSKA